MMNFSIVTLLHKYKNELVWKKIIFFIYLHIGASYGLYCLLAVASWKTFFWGFVIFLISSHGVTVGTHRLWTHRTFKAKLPLRILLAFAQTLTFQKDIYDWARDHRLHHKYSDTKYDPHNASRGFFYSHVGWLLLRKSKDVVSKGKEIDLSDLLEDPVVAIQRKYYWKMVFFVAFLFPALVPWYFWNESFSTSWYVCSILRICVIMNGTWSVNSVAHIWGNKPYDKNIRPVESLLVVSITFGEGFHNYHHTFPWDYKTAELGRLFGNSSARFIELMAKIGWAYDLKYASKESVEKRARKTGDGTWKGGHEHGEENVWGWGDKNMKKEDEDVATIAYQQVQSCK